MGDFLGSLLSPFASFLLPMSQSNAIPVTLVLLLVVFGLLIAAAPLISETLSRRGNRLDDRGTTDRIARVYRLLRVPETPLRERLIAGLYQDGRRDAAIPMDSDLFLLSRLVISLGLFLIGALLMMLTGTPAFLILGALGYVLPTIIVGRHNSARTKSILRDIPAILRRLETRISAGADIGEAFARISAREKRPLYVELAWAAGQMKIPGNETYDVLRKIDERNGIMFFAPLADQVERGARRGRRDGIDAFLAYIDKVLEDDESHRQAKIGGIANKILLVMVPFLLCSLGLAIGLPFIVSFVETGSLA